MMGIRWDINVDLFETIARTRAALPHAVHSALEHIGEVSAAQTPVQEGTLVRSQRITPETEIVNEGSIGYYTSYAVYVHEILRYRHPHGNAKFLEIPLRTEAETAKAIVARVISDAIGRT